jgi:hypothetical protein
MRPDISDLTPRDSFSPVALLAPMVKMEDFTPHSSFIDRSEANIFDPPTQAQKDQSAAWRFMSMLVFFFGISPSVFIFYSAS